jgi:hypothetical protein
MNAANNLALAPRGATVFNHDSHAMNEMATKQDLYNQGILIDARFDKVDSRFELVNKQFEIVDIQFTNLRTDIDSQFIKLRAEISDQFGKVFTMFGTLQVEQNKTLLKFGAFLIATMIAMLGIDRWWL